MADENNTDLTSEVTDANTVVATPAVKKTRAPRQKKAIAAGVGGAPEVVTSPALITASTKPAGPGRGRKAKAVEVSVEAPVAKVKATRMKRATKSEQAAPLTGLDEMEDLTKLEEENKQLRKLLSEKLRNENSDLRKRLGQA